MTRSINQAGIELIKQYEGFRTEAYPDPASGGDPWTVGYGHTGPEVKKGYTVTPEKAEEDLKSDLNSAEEAVSQLVNVEITDNQFSALVSFAYNEGPTNLKGSTLLKLLNSGSSKEEVAPHFLSWNKAKVKGILTEMPGLTKRRNAEKELFLS